MNIRYLTQAWLILLMAVTFSASLAAVHVALGERIAANKRNETLSQIPALVPGSNGAETETIANRTVYRATKDGVPVGWVILASGQGFADTIELLVGLDNDMQSITGLYVLAQKETPGLGNKIEEDGWRSQFQGKSTAAGVKSVKTPPSEPSQILAITGATISSESVCDIVNKTVAEVRAAAPGGSK